MKCEGRRQIHNHQLSCEAMFSSSRAGFLSVQFAVAIMILFARAAFAADVTIALPTKSFQMIIFPLAQERGYMKEEGVDLKVTFMEPTPSIQALVAGQHSADRVRVVARWSRSPRRHSRQGRSGRQRSRTPMDP